LAAPLRPNKVVNVLASEYYSNQFTVRHFASLVSTDLTGADLTGCHIYGISAWRLKLEGTKQQNLVITNYGEPEVIVDDLEVAQFIYLARTGQHADDQAHAAVPSDHAYAA
jgi:hypothetical protein